MPEFMSGGCVTFYDCNKPTRKDQVVIFNVIRKRINHFGYHLGHRLSILGGFRLMHYSC